ncbi:MAG: hypothetical protein CMA50_01875 [Euryarchaeota archaeon]|nr:hypothetical protein [Euryarchaeota archaeon]
MNYAIIDGTTVKSTGTIQQLFPNTSFSIAGVNADFLTANNVVELVENLSFTTPTQKLSIVDAYVDSGKAYSVKVESTTSEEQTTLTNQQWSSIRLQRDNLLKNTDWRASSDLTLSDDWKNYRQALRDVPTQSDPFNITWPTAPSS